MSSSRNPTNPSDYVNAIADHLRGNQSLGSTVSGVARQTAMAAAGTAAGGLFLGPAGALVGGVVGAVVGYSMSAEYDGLLMHLSQLNEEDKKKVAGKVQQLVGGTSWDQFVEWYNGQGHQQMLMTLLMELMKGAAVSAAASSASSSQGASSHPNQAPPPYSSHVPSSSSHMYPDVPQPDYSGFPDVPRHEPSSRVPHPTPSAPPAYESLTTVPPPPYREKVAL